MAQDVADKAVKEILGGGAQVGDPGIIQMLEQTLNSARQGRVSTIAILQTDTAGRIGMSVAGTNVSALVVASVQMQKMLTDQLFNPQRGNGMPKIMMPNH